MKLIRTLTASESISIDRIFTGFLISSAIRTTTANSNWDWKKLTTIYGISIRAKLGIQYCASTDDGIYLQQDS